LRDILAQFSVFAQSGDDWVNLLILVVVGVFWLIGAIAKALSRKGPVQQGKAKAEQRPRETWQERLAHKVEEIQRAAETRFDEAGRRIEEAGSRRQGRQAPPVREPGGKIAVRTGPRGESILVYEPGRPQGPSPEEQEAARRQQARQALAAARRAARVTPPVEPKIEAAATALKPMTAELASAPVEPSQSSEPDATQPQSSRKAAGLEPGAIIDYSDPDALRKAILHYEILGKPLALRKPAEQAAGF
jgi:hypothetical protein